MFPALSAFALLTLMPTSPSPSPSDDLWAAVDAKVYQASLCEAFVDGGSYTFHHKDCTTIECDEWDYTVTTSCPAAPAGSAVATIDQSKDGQAFKEDQLSESDWIADHRDLLRNEAAYDQSFGTTFALTSVTTTSDGNLRADYTVKTSGSGTVSINESGYWVLGTGPAIPQILVRYSNKSTIIGTEEVTDTLKTR